MSDSSTAAGRDPLVADIHAHATDLADGVIELRRTIHQWPEVGNHLPRTRDAVLAALDGLPLDITLHESTSGIVASLEGDRPGRTILLRGDMDALPLTEDTGLDFASQIDGRMHACGHDGHTAMLAGAARLLAERRSDLAGRVVFMFQPGEEGFHGARYMIEEGMLDVGPLRDGTASPVDAALAIHLTSSLPTGWFGTRAGPIMAAADQFRIKVIGQGGHASEPFRTLDPIPIAAEIVLAFQTMVTRTIEVFDPAVLTVGRITAGTTNNIIPEVAEIEGTTRALSEEARAKVHAGLQRVARGVAAAHGAEVEIEMIYGYPPTVNDAAFTDVALAVAAEVAGAERAVRFPAPIMGAEDFSYVLQKVPGAMVFLGATPAGSDPAGAEPNHSNHVYFDEAALQSGVELYAATALRHLATTA